MRNFLFSYLRDFNIIKLKKRNQLCICILFRYFIYLSFYLFIWQKIDQLNSQSKSTLYLYFIQVFYLFIILFIYLAERIDNPSNLPLRIAHNLLQEQNIFPKSGKRRQPLKHLHIRQKQRKPSNDTKLPSPANRQSLIYSASFFPLLSTLTNVTA